MRYNDFQRICSAFLICVMLLSVMPSQAIATGVTVQDENAQSSTVVNPQPEENPDSQEQEGVNGDLVSGEKYYLDNGLVLTLNEDGKSFTVVDFMNVQAKSVTIPDSYLGLPVTQIADLAFKGKTALEEVVLSDNITHIGDDVFSGCANLRYLEENGAKYIGSATNPHFYLLGAVSQDIIACTISEETKIIASYALHNCKQLTEIVIPDSVIQVGFRALRGCDNLQSVTLPFAGEVENGQVNNHVGFVFGARTYGGNISFVPTTITSLIIKRGSLQKNALYGLDGVKHLGLPSMPEPLGYYYGGETYEDNIDYIPAALTSVEVAGGALAAYAFYNCVNLESIVLRDGVTDIGRADEVFYNTKYYKNTASWVDGVLYSGNHLVKAKSTVSGDFVVREGTVSIGYQAFYSTGITSITIPASVASIGKDAFYGSSSLTAVYISDLAAWCAIRFENAYANPLARAKKLYLNGELVEKLVIPEGVTGIGAYAFYGCSGLTGVSIPNSVVSIGISAFEGCTGVTEMRIPFVGATANGVSNTHFGYIFGATIYSNNKNYVPTGLKSVTVGGGKVIDALAFFGCSNLTSVTLPASLERIGASAFSGCTGIADVYIFNMEAWGAVEFEDMTSNPLYYGAALHVNNEVVSELVIPQGTTVIESSAYRYWTGLTSVVIPEGVISIGDSAFEGCTGLASVTIPDSVVSIGAAAFQGCTGLTSITIGEGVQSIGHSAFYGCTAMTELNFNAVKMADWGRNNNVFYSAGTAGNGIALTIGAKVKRIPAYLRCPTYSTSTAPKITSIVFAEGSVCESIGDYAFYNLYNMTELAIPQSVTKIGAYAFYGWTGLTTIVIPDSVVTIGESAFYGCSKVTSITIGEGVRSIGKSAFYGCTVLANLYFNAVSMRDLSSGNDVFTNAGKMNAGITVTIGAKVERVPAYLLHSNSSTSYMPKNPSVVFAAGSVCESIGDYAFYYCAGMSGITIPQSVKYIGDYAFAYCSGLKMLTIPDSVVEIGNYAFYYCRNVTSITIGDGVVHIGDYAFYGCTKVTNLTIGKSVETIGQYAFYGQTVLTSLVIPDSVVSIGYSAFYGWTKLTSLTIGKGVTSLEKAVFSGCTALTELCFNATAMEDLPTLNSIFYNAGKSADGITVTFGANVTRIPASLFYATSSTSYAPKIVSVVFAGNVCESIGDYAFYCCSTLTRIAIPDSVTGIGSRAFYNCSGLTAVHITDLAAWLKIAFGDSSANPLYYAKNLYLNGALLTELVIPEGATKIGAYAFSNCTGLTSVNIPSSVTEVGEGAFAKCSNLTAVYIEDFGAWCQINFGDNEANPLYCGKKLYLKGELVTEGAIPEGAQTIGDNVFYGYTDLAAISIPDSVTSIGKNAFRGCTGLSSMDIPSSISCMELGAFEGCTGLTAVYIDNLAAWCALRFESAETNPLYYAKCLYLNGESVTQVAFSDGTTEVGAFIFVNCESLTQVTIPDSVTEIGNHAFRGCTGLSSVTFGEGITRIGSYAFFGCAALDAISIPDKVTSIGDSAFYGCTGIKSISIPEGVTGIGQSAFFNCTGLRTVTIPASVSSIGSAAFYGCNGLTGVYISDLAAWCNIDFGGDAAANPTYYAKKLYLNRVLITQVEFPEGTTEIGDYTFSNCTGITSVTIPEGVTSIGSAFYGCSGLTDINLPDSVTSIGARAFYGCTGLKSITIPEGVTSIPNRAFYGCGGLTKVTMPESVTSIETYAFYNCTGLTDIVIPKNVTSIGTYAFYGCTGLTEIHYNATAATNLSSNNYTFYNAGKSSGGITVTVGANVTKIPAYLFYPCSSSSYYARVTDIVFEEGSLCTSIGNYAFRYCADLVSITYPNTYAKWKTASTGTTWYQNTGEFVVYCSDATVTKAGEVTYLDAAAYSKSALGLAVRLAPFTQWTRKLEEVTVAQAESAGLAFTSNGDGTCYVSGIGTCTDAVLVIPSVSPAGDTVVAIGGNAFYNNNTITSVVIPSTVTQIGAYAFSYCLNLTDVTIPYGVTSIGNDAFYGDAALTSAVLPDSLTKIGAYAFSGCKGLTSIVIPDSVTDMGRSAFESCSGLTSLSIGKGLTSISYGAFYYCQGLTEITIPSTVTSLEGSAFAGCSGLTSVTIPDNVTSIGMSAFGSCVGLTSITLPFVGEKRDGTGETNFGYIFGYSNSSSVPPTLREVIISGGEGEISIADNAFEDCSYLTSITLSDKVTGIGSYAFYDCTSLESITIPESVTSIGEYAFYYCTALTDVTILGGVTSVGYGAFSSCSRLTGMHVTDLADWCQISFETYSTNPLRDGAKLYLNGVLVTDPVIPDGVTAIGDYAFAGYSSLYTVTIPESVTSIGKGVFHRCENLKKANLSEGLVSIGEQAFYYCFALSTITIPSTVERIGTDGFDLAGLTAVYITDLAAWCEIAFGDADANPLYRCGALYCNNELVTKLELPEGTKKIGDYAFYYYAGLTEISIPDSVTSIGSYAFAYCTGVKSITISSGVASIGDYAFYKSSKLAKVTFAEGTMIRSIGNQAFGGTLIKGTATIVYPDDELSWRFVQKSTNWDGGLTTWKESFVFGKEITVLYEMSDDRGEFYVGEYCGTGENANVPEFFGGRPVTEIYEKAFYNAQNLKTVIVPHTIRYIYQNAFYNCPKITEIVIHGSDVVMERGIIYGCEALQTLTVPFLGRTAEDAEHAYLGYLFGAASCKDNEIYVPISLRTVTVTDAIVIGDYAFEGCEYLVKIQLPDSLETIGSYAFSGCEGLEGEWVLPEALISIGDYAFASCNGLNKIALPEGLVEIGKYAFSGCISLREMILPDSVTTIGVMLLDGSDNVRTIAIGSGLRELPDVGAGNAIFGLDKAASSLTAYTVSESNAKLATDERGVLYELHENLIAGQKIKVAVLDAPAKADLKDYELPEHIVYIAPYAFAYNISLRWIQLDRVRRIDKCAFLEATSLVAAVFGSEDGLDAEAQQYAQAYDAYIADKHREGESYSQFIGEQAFFGCTMLRYVNIWTDFIVSIGQEAFYDCGMLSTVRLSESVGHIGHRAFGKTALESITVAENNARYADFDHVLYEKLEDGSYKLVLFPACKTVASDSAVGKVYQTVFELPENVAVSMVESYAFQDARYLKEVRLNPNAAMLVGDYAFQDASIQSVYIGEKVTSLGLIRGEGEYTVFESCESLTAIDVAEGNAYYSSESGVLFDKEQSKLIKYPYHKLGREYSLPNTVSVIASMAFKGNKNLTHIVIPAYVHTVGLEAFYDCANLVTIYFDHVYAPVSVLENAFTTNTVAGATTRALLSYSAGYYENGGNGEYGWKNYEGIYPLYESNVVPSFDSQKEGNVFYAVVVVDSSGVPVDGAMVSLTDYNGVTEVISAAGGIAMFYDRSGDTENAVFSIGFEDAYTVTVSDPSGIYYTFTNPALLLDEDMLITYITLTRLPTAYGVSCNGQDINSERLELNKSNIDYTDILLDEFGDIQYAADGTPMFDEAVEISVIGYCDAGYSFADGECGLYQNGVKIAEVDRTEQQDGGVIFYFRPKVAELANDVDIEVRLTAVSDTEETLSCSTVLNIHVFDFYIDKSELDLDDANVGIDFGAAGEFVTGLLGGDGFELSFGENVKLTTSLEDDIVTFELEGSKELNEKKKKLNNDYEQGFNENNKKGMQTYRFQYTAAYIDEYNLFKSLCYNIVFTRETEDSGYYYYRCKIHKAGAGVNATKDNLLVTYYGVVNKLDAAGMDDRAAAKMKADLIFATHYAYVLSEGLRPDDVESGVAKARYSEAVIQLPDKNQKLTTQKLEVSISGAVSFQYVGEGNFRCTGGSVKGNLVYKFTHDQQMVIWVIPVTLHVEVSAEGELSLTIELDEQQKVDWEVLLTLEVDIAARIGVGCSVASVGFYGNIGTVFVLEILPEFSVDSWKIYGEMGAYARVLWFEYKYRFTPKSWADGYYIVEPKDAASNASEERMLSESGYLASLYLADSYAGVNEQTLLQSYQPVVIDGELYKICYADVSGLADYDPYNHVKLALSKWDGAQWSEPVIIDDNGLNDAEYVLYQQGGKLMMVYTQQTQKLTEDSADDTYAAAQALQIKVVELSGEMGTPVTVAQPDSYAYLTQYAVVDGVPTVVWAENADNNIFGVSPHNYIDNSGKSHVFATTANSVWTSRFVDGSWSAPECMAEGLSAVTQITVNEDGYVAYIVDTNGDLTDTTDRVLYHGALDGEKLAFNDTAVGSVKAVIADGDRFLYYYDAVDEEQTDGWDSLSAAAADAFPQNAPEEFELLYDENGDMYAILYSANKAWMDAGLKQVGSAIYGRFMENGVWGEPVELAAYVPENDRYVQEFTAVLAGKEIFVSAATMDSAGENMRHSSGSCQIGPKLTVELSEIDYATSKVTFTVKNQGTCTTEVYMSIDGGECTPVSEALASGHSVEHSVVLSNAVKAAQTVCFAMTANGDGAVCAGNISMAYSDLQTNVKQVLLGENDFLLFSVRNLGNAANTGLTIIRNGNYDATAIVSDAAYRAAMALNLKAGEVTAFTFVNENGQIETAWAVVDLVQSGAIVYHELALAGLTGNAAEPLVCIYTVPQTQLEPASMRENNYACLNYGECQGVLQSGEAAGTGCVLGSNAMEFDGRETEELVIKFFCPEEDTVQQVRFGDTVLAAESYRVEKLSIGGQIRISNSVLADMSGSVTVSVEFVSGEVCQMTLKIRSHYTVVWTDDGKVLKELEVSDGAVPEFGENPEKASDDAWVYTFAGWDYTGDGVADPVTEVTGNVTYQAVWDTAPRSYTVQWSMLQTDGAEIQVTETYLYGDIPSYLGTVFTPDGMQFAGWDAAVMPVIGDAVYTAVYEPIKPVMVGLEIGKLPEKTTYMQGQMLDLTGLVAYKVMSDGTKTAIHNHLLDAKADLSAVGEATVTLSYAGFAASFQIEVVELDASLMPKLTAVGGETAAGRTVTVAVGIENNPGIISMRYQVVYDQTAMELIRVQDTGVLHGYNEPAPGIYSPYTLHWIDPQATADNEAQGTIVLLTFLILDETQCGTYEITIEPIESRNCNGESVRFYGTTAEVTVVDVLLGDVDLDGEVTDWDVILLKRHLAGWPDIEIHTLAADIDGDGEVTDWDCILLDRYLMGWYEELG